MKINRRGFTLAEVVVASVTVATILITLFVGLNRMTKAYETRNRYYSIDAMYAAMEINDMIKRFDGNYKSNFENELNDNDSISMINFFGSSYQEYNDFDSLYYNEFKYDIFAYVAKNNKDSLEKLKSFNNDGELYPSYVKTKTFDEYIDYLKNNVDPDANYSYLVIVELRNINDINDINDCQYYTLKVRGDNNA